MRTFAQKQKPTLNTKSSISARSSRAFSGQSREVSSSPHLQRMIGNQAKQRLLQPEAENNKKGSFTNTLPPFVHDFSGITVHPTTPAKNQLKLEVNTPGDKYEQEADCTAEEVMRMPDLRTAPEFTAVRAVSPGLLQRKCAGCDNGGGVLCPTCAAEQAGFQTATVTSRIESGIHRVCQSGGKPLTDPVRAFFEPRFGQDFSPVRVHTNGAEAELSRNLGARAFTIQNHIFFGAAQFRPDTSTGKHLPAHELTHVIQQGQASRDHSETVPAIQREANQPTTEEEQLTVPLTDREWQQLELWQSRGEVGIDPLTEDPDHNALVVADAIFCGRLLGSVRFNDPREDPLLCVISDVTRADPRVQQIAQHVTMRGPIINWTRVNVNQRMLHVMELLVNEYGFPENGAAGLVGNLRSESGVLPTKIEAAGRAIRDATPLTDRDFADQQTDFTAEEVMNRNRAARQGPARPGIGIAQWTSPGRRAGLFQHVFNGRHLGASILFNLDAQVDYLVSELQSNYAGVYGVLTEPGVSLNAASDEVVYNYEIPGSILGGGGKLPRANAAVQAVFGRRRGNSQGALRVFRLAHP